MTRTSRPAISGGIALVSASLIAITPTAAPPHHILDLPVQLTTIEHGDLFFPEVGWDEMVANTTANGNGLMEMYGQSTNLFSLPSAVYSEGVPKVFNDLVTQLQALATYSAAVTAQNGALDPNTPLPPLPDFFSNPVTNPVSVLTLVLQNAIASNFASNAAQVGWEGIRQNMLPSFNDIGTQFSSISTQLQTLFTDGTFSVDAFQTDLTDIGNDLTAIGGYLSLAPSTILNSYLNGYPIVSASPDGLNGIVPSVGDAYTLNAPFNETTNVAITPYFGLLTNPFAAFTENVGGFGDGASPSFLGTAPMITGTLASLLQTQQTLAHELLTVTSTIPGSGVDAPPVTDALTILGPDSINIDLDLLGIPVVGDVISGINTAIDSVNSAVSELIGYLNTFVSGTLDAVVNPFIGAVDGVIDLINAIPGVDIDAIGEVSLTIPTIPEIPSIPTDIAGTIGLPDVTAPGVPAYVWDLAMHQMAILGSMASIAAPVTGTVSSDGIGNFLAPDAIMNLGSIFNATMESILGDGPLAITATLPLDWTDLIATSLANLFTG